ncbi:thiol reductant ABC exporter subunit CydD [Methylocystis sp.]|uniref:thiol reductant ABC exporter subunit CydD n=1 Tax=Methylocystis sp. TaxID=1911079 RepID=UPI003DA49BAC
MTTVVLAGATASLFVVGQAFALSAVVVAAVRGDSLTGPLIALAAVFCGRVISSSVSDTAAGRAAATVSASMREKIVAATIAGRASKLSEGELTSLATRGVASAEPYLTRYLPALVLAAVLPLLTVVVMATQDLLSAIIVLATLPLVPVFGALVGLATRARAESQWRAMASLSGHFVDVMKGLATLVAFRRAEAQSDTIRSITHRYRRATIGTLRIAFASSAVLELVATLSVALVAVTVGVRLAAGDLGLFTALVVLLLAPEAYWPLRRVGAEFHAAAEGVATFEQMSELGSAAAPRPEKSAPLRDVELRLDSVCFTYPGRSEPTLSSVNLAVPGRSVVAVTGPSGCGKSTLLALMAGLAVPTSGTVTLGGRAVDERASRAQVAWLPQRPSFLTASVADNLRLGAPHASSAELWSALRKVALAERIVDLGGLDAVIEEDAGNLSAGERARLALARVVVAHRSLVLLDEPTAHLDPLTQQILLDVIVELSSSAAVVVVAHDDAVVAIADRVVELAASPDPRPLPVPATATGSTPASAEVSAGEDLGDARPSGFWLSTVLGVLASASGVALTATAGWLIVKASEHPATLTLLVAIVGVRAFGLGRPVFRYFERLRSHDAALRLLAERRVQVYDVVVPLTPGRLGKRRGDLLATIVDDVDAVLDRELRLKLPLRTFGAVLLGAAAVAWIFLPSAALVVGGTGALGGLMAYAVARIGTQAPEAVVVSERAQLSAVVLETTHLAEELRMWQAENVVLDRLRTLNADLGTATRRIATALAAARASVQLYTFLGIASVALVGSDALARGDISAPALALLLLIPLAVGEVATGVAEAGGIANRIAAAEGRLAALEAMVPAVSEPVAPRQTPDRVDVEVVAASLGWDGTAVLDDFDLELAEGEKLGIVGPSGSGKSTLAAALIRFIDPVRGRICLGGEDLAELALGEVRGRVGYVDDDPYVFATTLRENVRLARPDATDDDVVRCLRQAHLGDWLDSLPDGLETWLGDGHAAVSGGERARLGLARSLLLDQPVLVLDEPVAHLDAATATKIADDLLTGAAGRSVVWITHSSVGLADLDRVVDLGSATRVSDLPV